MVDWTDELRAKVVEDYQKAEPTPDNSMDIVNEIAEEIGATPNGVRMILMKNEVYVNKTPASGSTASSGGGGSKRVSKADAQASLSEAISATGQEPNMEIIEKLTGKAAVYLAEVINKATD